MSSKALEELDRLLGIEKPQSAASLAEEHGVTEHRPTEHLCSVSEGLAALLVRVGKLPASHAVPVLLAGLSKALKAARAEGPGVVDHLADELLVGATTLLPATPEAKASK